nr:MAG TPA: hypothetical protein [Caudoviricetes sp.]
MAAIHNLLVEYGKRHSLLCNENSLFNIYNRKG